MAQKRSERMGVVLMLAEKQEQAAAEKVRLVRDQLKNEEAQLVQLSEYANQYLDSYGQLKTNIYADQLMSYSSFLQRLEKAKEDQLLRVEKVKLQLDQVIGIWQQTYQKRQSIENLIVKLQHEESIIVEKRLQKELDELVNQAQSRRLQEH